MADDPEGVPLPPLPKFNVVRVFETRDRLMDLTLDAMAGTLAAGLDFEAMVEAVRRALNSGGDAIEHLPLFNSMRYLVGREMTPKLLRELAWRLAGNLGPLKAGAPVPPWARQTVPEWVPVQVVATRYAIQKKPHEKRGRPGRTMRFLALAGTPCPGTMTQWWSNEKIGVVATAVGFRRKPPLVMADKAELMSMRFAALVEPARSQREPGFYHVACPPAFMEYNRALIRKRRRIRFECPEGFDHPCHLCHLGARSCEAAVHPEDYEAKPCPSCRRTWWFDTDTGFVNDHCVQCQPLVSAGIPVKAAPPPEAK